MAFTQTDSRVIRVCTPWSFRNRSRLTREIIVIHEFLHTLGLGENPEVSHSSVDLMRTQCAGSDISSRL
jgi:hypothetical protein